MGRGVPSAGCLQTWWGCPSMLTLLCVCLHSHSSVPWWMAPMLELSAAFPKQSSEAMVSQEWGLCQSRWGQDCGTRGAPGLPGKEKQVTTYLGLHWIPKAPKMASLLFGPTQVPALRACFAPQLLSINSMKGDSPQVPTEVTRGPVLTARRQASFYLFNLFFVWSPCFPHSHVTVIPMAESVR